jgi:hypothetical protein
MNIRTLVVLCALVCASCRSMPNSRAEQLARVAKDWCLTIRASQVMPVYPLTEDLQVGDVFLVSTTIQEEIREFEAKGFLPLDNQIARIDVSGFAQFYNGAYAVQTSSVLPRQWQFPNPARTASPLTDWAVAPGAAFPSYTFTIKKGAGATLALPIQAVPVGLSLLHTASAVGTVNITNASTYGLSIIDINPQVDAWAAQNRDFLRQYGPQIVDGGPLSNYVRIVYRVYVAGGVNVSMVNDDATGGRVDAGASKAVALFDAGSTTNAVNAASDYEKMLASLSQSVASSTPGANLTLSSVSSRAIAMNETFPRPLVIGFLAYDRAIDSQGNLGPPIPTHARVRGKPVAVGAVAYGADGNTEKIRTWLAADPINRQKLRDWLQANGEDPNAIPLVLNGESYESMRADIVRVLVK